MVDVQALAVTGETMEVREHPNNHRKRGLVDRDDVDRPLELVRSPVGLAALPHRTTSPPTSQFDQIPGNRFDPYGLLALQEAQQQRNYEYSVDTSISGDDSTANDAAMAAALQRQLDLDWYDQDAENVHKSLALARAMQEEEDSSTIASIGAEGEMAGMSSTPSGKAWMLVERILTLMDEISLESQQNPPTDSLQFNTVSTDDMVFLAERMFEFQESFRQGGKPTLVDIGFHFTNSKSLDKIKTDGLLSKVERSATGIAASNNGSKYGDGVSIVSWKQLNATPVRSRLRNTDIYRQHSVCIPEFRRHRHPLCSPERRVCTCW